MVTNRVLVWVLVLLAVRPETLLRSEAVFAGELSNASPEKVGLASEKLARVEAAVQALIEDRKIAGAVVMVARRGHVAYAKAAGKMDIEAGKPMQLDTIFRIYSMTKPIVSVATLMLEEEGKCRLDDPASRYLPELRGLKVYRSGTGDEIELEFAEREPTVRDLLRHTSGLTYGFFSTSPVDRIYNERGVPFRGDLATMVDSLGEIPLLYQPGTRWHYSVSVDVLGRLVEVLSGQPLDDFLRRRIFEPLDMRDTGFHVPPGKLHRFATNYGPADDGGVRVVEAPATSRFARPPKMLSGGGGLVSTARDYLRFCQMLAGYGELQGTRLLRRSTVELMSANQLPGELIPIAVTEPMEGRGFGLGVAVRVATSPDSAGRVGEYGWSGAASTHFWISPRDDLIVVALSQRYPFWDQLERTVKPLVYDAIVER